MNMDIAILFVDTIKEYIKKDIQNGNFNFDNLGVLITDSFNLSVTMYDSMLAIAGYYE